MEPTGCMLIVLAKRIAQAQNVPAQVGIIVVSELLRMVHSHIKEQS